MTVYVLFHETNTGSADDSDGYVEAVYATRELAEAARLDAIKERIAAGDLVWWNPEFPDDDGPDNWEHDFSVQAYDVIDQPIDVDDLGNPLPADLNGGIE